MFMAAQGVWTLDALDRLPDDGNRYELLNGELLVTPAPSPAHELLANELRALLEPYVRRHSLGRVFVPRAVVRASGSELEPDLMVRSVPAVLPDSWEQMPVPLLIAEILSPTTRRRDLSPKRTFYREYGVATYWCVDGDARAIRVMRAGERDIVADSSLTWHPAGASEALTIDVAQYFRDALGPALSD
jgi:Uma2 family endonuclease